MTTEQLITECKRNLNHFHQWYEEKQKMSWHKSFTYEWLKEQIKRYTEELEALEAIQESEEGLTP